VNDETSISSRFIPVKKPFQTVGFLVLLLALAGAGYGQSGDMIELGKFSEARPGGPFPPGWKPLNFKKIKKHTAYSLVQDGDTVAVKAVSRQSSSGLTRRITIDPKEYPVVQWKWKVENILKKGDVTKKAGDDYPARLYITFAYDSNKVGFFGKVKYEAIRLIYGEYPPLGAISYIWESRSPKGTRVPSPFTSQLQMFVVESGKARLHQWMTEERNVYEDYKEAFGREPPRISGVAIMVDTDNTGESATAYFGDITFKKAP